MTLKAEFDDPFLAAAEAASLLGFDEETMLAAKPPEARDAEAVSEIFRTMFQEGHGYPGTEPDTERAWQTIRDDFLVCLPTRLTPDYKVHAHRVAARMTNVLDVWDFDLQVSLASQSDERRPALSGPHPEAIVVRLTDLETGDTLREVPLRLFPHKNEWLATTDHVAMAALLNHGLLYDSGLELVAHNESPGDHTPLLLLERDRLDTLEERYGEGIPLFHRGDPLIDRDLFEYGSLASRYVPENETDHERAFGVPEPDGTVRLESLSATEHRFR